LDQVLFNAKLETLRDVVPDCDANKRIQVEGSWFNEYAPSALPLSQQC
jgi:hypothetical protein